MILIPFSYSDDHSVSSPTMRLTLVIRIRRFPHLLSRLFDLSNAR